MLLEDYRVRLALATLSPPLPPPFLPANPEIPPQARRRAQACIVVVESGAAAAAGCSHGAGRPSLDLVRCRTGRTPAPDPGLRGLRVGPLPPELVAPRVCGVPAQRGGSKARKRLDRPAGPNHVERQRAYPDVWEHKKGRLQEDCRRRPPLCRIAARKACLNPHRYLRLLLAPQDPQRHRGGEGQDAAQEGRGLPVNPTIKTSERWSTGIEATCFHLC